MTMTRYLDFDTVLAINRIVAGKQNLVNKSMLLYTLDAMQSARDQDDERKVMIKRTALLLHGIVQGHVFTDGNKRTGFVCATVFLRKNGWSLKPLDTDELVSTLLEIAKGNMDRKAIERWLEMILIRTSA